jgi:hypothetical protein
MRHNSIQFGKNTVTKTSTPDLMRVEVEKTRRAFEIGKDCGLFRVPEVLEYNEGKGVAVFERIYGLNSTWSLMSGSSQYKSIIEQVGRSLAIIHRKLVLPDKMTIMLTSEFNLPGTEVFLHGDFNGINVCVSTCSSSVVILDWQMTSRHGGRSTYGSRYFDIVWFFNYILWTPTIKYLFSDPVSAIARYFLESYFKESGLAYDKREFVQYAKNFFDTKLPFRKQHTSWKVRYLLKRSNILTGRFVKSLETMIPNEKLFNNNSYMNKGDIL